MSENLTKYAGRWLPLLTVFGICFGFILKFGNLPAQVLEEKAARLVLEKKVEGMNEVLIRIDERTKAMARKQGVEKE